MWEPLKALVNTAVEIETTDGCRRKGILTGISWSKVTVGEDARELSTPVGVRLDNEPGDELPWNRLLWIREN